MIQLQLDRETGKGTLIGFSEKVEEITSVVVQERIPNDLIERLVILENRLNQLEVGSISLAGRTFNLRIVNNAPATLR